MKFVCGARVVGPLELYVSGFADELARLGYTSSTRRLQLGLVAHFSRWLAGCELKAGAVTSATIHGYLVTRRAAGYRAFRSPKALAPLLVYLRGLGVVPPEPVKVLWGIEMALDRFRSYLLTERGVKVKVAAGYVDSVRPFVAAHAIGGAVEVADLSATDVTAFLVAQSRRLAPKTMQRLASALRALLRFWHLDGMVSVSLADAVPRVAYRQTGLPKGLPPAQVNALLASCDLGVRTGYRDLAILTLLARMGLRAGEVAGLQLDDVDWRHGEIMLRSKGNRCDRLPLPVDAGQVLADYLRAARPADALDRSVFVRVNAPHRGLTSTGVTQVVNAAAHRAGLGTIYAHRLRHSTATSMLAAGAPLAEIGQLLRHRSALTTAVYAKVDTEALRKLARPWPVIPS
jgi:integrase/recombinase XerD